MAVQLTLSTQITVYDHEVNILFEGVPSLVSEERTLWGQAKCPF